MPRDALMNRLGPGMMQHGIMAEIQREFNELFAKVDALEKRLKRLEPSSGEHITLNELKGMFGQKTDDSRVPKEYTEAYLNKLVHDVDVEFKQQLAKAEKQEQKEEAHPATQTSFVLKI